MQTSFKPEFLQTADGQRVNEILRNCVHCGFCNATCPTYQLTGNELDGPRGRIYLIKGFFEEKGSSNISMNHLDRCLTCLACETTCPSGVEYGDLIDIGRKHIEASIKRPVFNKLKRSLIISIFSKPARVATLFSLARLFKPLLPSKLAKKIPAKIPGKLPSRPPSKYSAKNSSSLAKRKMLTIKGCVQSVAAPQINAAASQVLQQSDIQLDEAPTSCCGALAFHLTDLEKAKRTIRSNINNWYGKLSNSHENLVIVSSGCSSFIKQYGTIMQDDNRYTKKAKFISERCKDLSEITTEIKIKTSEPKNKTVALHSPCTLQHGQKIVGSIETKLQEAGYELVEVQNSDICCGSAGAYSLLQTELSTQLLHNKVTNLEAKQPDIIATANIGCLMHLQSGTKTPIKHWIELLTEQ